MKRVETDPRATNSPLHVDSKQHKQFDSRSRFRAGVEKEINTHPRKVRRRQVQFLHMFVGRTRTRTSSPLHHDTAVLLSRKHSGQQQPLKDQTLLGRVYFHRVSKWRSPSPDRVGVNPSFTVLERRVATRGSGIDRTIACAHCLSSRDRSSAGVEVRPLVQINAYIGKSHKVSVPKSSP